MYIPDFQMKSRKFAKQIIYEMLAKRKGKLNTNLLFKYDNGCHMMSLLN